MTSAEKHKIAGFLDLAGDFLVCGYRSDQKEYQFDDDNELSYNSALTADSLEQIADEVRNCKNCELWRTRTNAAPGEGVKQPLVMVIGEGPGKEEDAQGRPFVGQAGQLLDKMLASIDLSREKNCFIANVIKCRPPFNRDPFPEETACCAGFLERQICLLRPKFILSAGRISAQTLLRTTESVARLRGKFTELTVKDEVYPFLVTYHPAALLRSEDLKRPAWEDLKLLRSRIENGKNLL